MSTSASLEIQKRKLTKDKRYYRERMSMMEIEALDQYGRLIMNIRNLPNGRLLRVEELENLTYLSRAVSRLISKDVYNIDDIHECKG